MEQNQVSCGSVVYDRLPSVSAKYLWLVAQSLEGEGEGEQGTEEQFFYTINDPMCQYRCQIPELLGRRIRGCFHGWVILSEDPHNVMWCLWNPMTSKIIRLPPLNLEDGDSQSISHCCLSSSPDHPNSVLLLTRNDKSSFVFCRLDHTKEWAEMSYAKQLKKISGNGRLVSNLTCCNGKVYALTSGGSYASFVIHVDIVVKDREVVINLFFLGACPCAPYNQYSSGDICFLKGSDTELFYILVGFRDRAKKTIGFVSLFKLDTTSINWEIIDGFKDRDITSFMDDFLAAKDPIQYLEMSNEMQEDMKILDMTCEMWEELEDIKDAIFFVDLARDYSVFYSPTVSSELGGYIHIRSEIGDIIQSYCLKEKTISISSMPSRVLPTSHVSVWECNRLEDGRPEVNSTVVSKQVKNDEIRSNESFLLNIPFKALKMIIDCCCGVEYMNFRATCKYFRLAAPLTPLRTLQTYSPFLMELDNDRHFITFTHPMLGDKSFIRYIPLTMKDDTIRCSSYGWLLFYTDNRDLVFYNPFTTDILELPYLDFYFGQVCISASPTSLDCMVVGFFREDVYILFVNRETSWRTLSLGVDSNSMLFSTFFGRDIYVLCKNGELHVFKDLDKEDYSPERVVVETPRRSSKAEYFLTKCDQHLLLVIVEENGKSVEVFKLNVSRKEWEKTDDLGRNMICICDTTCFCIEAKSREMGNKIYFPRFHSKNEKMVFYSLETQMCHTFNGKNIDATFEGFIGTHRCLKTQAWI